MCKFAYILEVFKELKAKQKKKEEATQLVDPSSQLVRFILYFIHISFVFCWIFVLKKYVDSTFNNIYPEFEVSDYEEIYILMIFPYFLRTNLFFSRFQRILGRR